jgi:hypothetical protein
MSKIVNKIGKNPVKIRNKKGQILISDDKLLFTETFT